MNSKSFELNIAILFSLLFVLTLILFNALHVRLVSMYYNCFGLCGIYVYSRLQIYLLYCYMQPTRTRNDIKVHASCNYRFLYQQWIS